MQTINKLDEARTKAFDHMMSVWHRAAAAPWAVVESGSFLGRAQVAG